MSLNQKNMKLVAVSQRVDVLPERNETRDALDQRLITFMLVAGFIPVPMPNVLYKDLADGRRDHKALDTWLAALKPAAVVLSGGNDIAERPERDASEYALLDYAENLRLPVLGICRGMQILGCRAGTELCPVAGHVRTRHVLTGEITCEVNSYHAYALKDCPDGFVILAKSKDGEIEAIRHQSLPWEGWMWHPEREAVFAAHDIQRLKTLFA